MIPKEERLAKLHQLYALYEQPMYRIAYAILHHTEQAEDAVSDSFCHIIKNLNKIETPESPQTKQYIIQIIRNTAINQYRRNQREAQRSTEWDERVMQIPDKAEDPERESINSIQDETLLSILNMLNETDREIILMRCRDELSFREIAQRLSLKEATARKRYERAKKMMQKQKGVMYYETQQFSTQ